MIYWVEKSVVENTNVVLRCLFKEVRNEAIGIANFFIPSKKTGDNKELSMVADIQDPNEILPGNVQETFFGVEKIISRSMLRLSDVELQLQKEQLLAEIDACLE
jgi:hypothetical protein